MTASVVLFREYIQATPGCYVLSKSESKDLCLWQLKICILLFDATLNKRINGVAFGSPLNHVTIEEVG